jgi:hypothetical protein
MSKEGITLIQKLKMLKGEQFNINTPKTNNGSIMVSMLASSAVDHGFRPRSDQTEDFKIGICCFSAKPTALRRKSKDWLARNQNNVPERNDMSHCEPTSLCSFSAKNTALRRKSKDWLAQNQNNVPEWTDMSHHGLLFQ